MKIAIMSDCHDNWENFEKAIEKSNTEKCDYLLFAGDLISPTGADLLNTFNGKSIFVWGNNEGERLGLVRKMDASEKITLAGNIFEGEIDGIKIFMNHFPRISELAAKSNEFDLCIHGHSHQFRNDRVGNTLLINPGEIHGDRTNAPSFVIFDTQSKEVIKLDI